MAAVKGFKVTDAERKLRVGIAVKSLEDLKKKTLDKFKLKLSENQIFFQTPDGTVIENNDYLQTLQPQTLLIWTRQGERADTDAEILYKTIREVNEEYLTAGEKVQEFFTEKMKNKVYKLAEVLKGIDDDKINLSLRDEHPEWFEGLDTSAKTKEEYMFRRAQDRIRTYYYKTRDELSKTKDIPQLKLQALFKTLQGLLKNVSYYGCYFDRRYALASINSSRQQTMSEVDNPADRLNNHCVNNCSADNVNNILSTNMFCKNLDCNKGTVFDRKCIGDYVLEKEANGLSDEHNLKNEGSKLKSLSNDYKNENLQLNNDISTKELIDGSMIDTNTLIGTNVIDGNTLIDTNVIDGNILIDTNTIDTNITIDTNKTIDTNVTIGKNIVEDEVDANRNKGNRNAKVDEKYIDLKECQIKLNNIKYNQENISQEKIAQEKITQEKIAQEKIAQEKIPQGNNLNEKIPPQVSICDSKGLFVCQGRWDREKCLYTSGHEINPYKSREDRIVFQTWNLDHNIERSRSIIPSIEEALSQEAGDMSLDILRIFKDLFTLENMKLVHIVCHDKGAHTSKQAGPYLI